MIELNEKGVYGIFSPYLTTFCHRARHWIVIQNSFHGSDYAFANIILDKEKCGVQLLISRFNVYWHYLFWIKKKLFHVNVLTLSKLPFPTKHLVQYLSYLDLPVWKHKTSSPFFIHRFDTNIYLKPLFIYISPLSISIHFVILFKFLY